MCETMKQKSYIAIFAAAFSFLSRLVISEPFLSEGSINCSLNDGKCPEEWPCCSPYGVCGSGPTCVGGCNPQFSFNDMSCLPSPILIPYDMLSFKSEDSAVERLTAGNLHKSKYILRAESRLKEKELELQKNKIIHYTNYLITNSSDQAREMLIDYKFVHSGLTQIDRDTGNIQLTMPKRSTGSLIATTKSFLYGKISVNMTTARSGGVITALVLMSAVGDELDFEFVGSELNSVQTNHYFQGELDYTKMKKHSIEQDTWRNYHTYELSWSEQQVDWMIDGQIIRTLYKNNTWDNELNVYKYPESPMRLEVAIWPGGSEKNEIGTIMWAGGLVDWDNAPDMLEKGYFAVNIQSISIETSANRHMPRIYHCLTTKSGKDINELLSEDLKKVYFTYNSTKNPNYNEDSLEWDCVDDIYLPSMRSSGLHSNRSKGKLLDDSQSWNKEDDREQLNSDDEIDIEEWYRSCSTQSKPKRESSQGYSRLNYSRTFVITLIILIAIII